MNLRDYRLSRYPGVCQDVVSAGHTTYVVAYCCVEPSACRCDYEQAWRLCCDCMLLHQAASYRCLGFVGILALCVEHKADDDRHGSVGGQRPWGKGKGRREGTVGMWQRMVGLEVVYF